MRFLLVVEASSTSILNPIQLTEKDGVPEKLIFSKEELGVNNPSTIPSSRMEVFIAVLP